MPYERNPEIVSQVQRLYEELHNAGFEEFMIGSKVVEDGTEENLWDAIVVKSDEHLSDIQEYLEEEYDQSTVVKSDEILLFQF